MQKQIQVPDEIQAKVDQFMANARARFGHGVYRMDANDQGGNQGGSQGGDGSGGDGGNQNQGGSQGGSILDREAEGGDQGGDQSGGEGGQGNGQQNGGNVDLQEIVTQVTQALEGRFDSIADRRVNAILREVRNQNGQQQGGNGQQGGDGGGNSGGSSEQVQSGPADGDVREARLAYREYVGDQIRFLGDQERETAMTLAQGMLRQRLVEGDDPDTAGREVARKVAKQVKGLRTHYENRILAALRRDGVIPAEAGQPAQPLQGGSQPGAESGFKAGQATAQRLLADRMPQQQ